MRVTRHLRHGYATIVAGTAASVALADWFFYDHPVDRIVCDFNAAHCREAGGGAGPIDLDYLRELGPDALPALRAVEPNLPPARRAAARQHAAALEAELRAQLADWRGWTLRRLALQSGTR